MAARGRGALCLGAMLALAPSCGVDRGSSDAPPEPPLPPPSGMGAFVRCSQDGWCAAPALRRSTPTRTSPTPPREVPAEFYAVASLGGGRFLAAGTKVVTFSREGEWPPTDVSLGARLIHAAAPLSDGRVLLADHLGTLTVARPGIWGSSYAGPVIAPIRGLHRLADDDVYLVGDQKNVLHYQGNTLVPLSGSPVAPLEAVWGTVEDGLWAVGPRGTIVHLTQWGTWEAVPSPVAVDLHAVSGSGPDDVWVVGDAGLTLHLAEGAWKVVVSPTDQQLLGVSIVGPTQGFAVGAGGTVLSLDAGGAWQVVPCTATADLRAVAVDAREHVAWAVGGAGTLVTGWDAFAPVPYDEWPEGQPGLLEPPPTITSLVVQEDQWLLWVGSNATLDRVDEMRAFAYHATLEVAAMAQTADDTLFIAGPTGSLKFPEGTPITSAFSRESAPAVAVAALAPDDVWFAAPDGVRHYQGLFAGLFEFPGAPVLHAIGGASQSALFTVGDHGRLFRFDRQRQQFGPMQTGTDANLLALWAASPELAFAVGESGTILRFDGSGWQPEMSGVKVTLRAVTGLRRDGSWQVFAAGDSGTILRRRGPGSWTAEASGTARDLHALTAAGPWVLAGGERYTLLRKEIPGYR